MDMTMSIASMGMAMSTSQFMLDVNFALMGKTLDIAQIQGEAMQEMVDVAQVAAPSFHMLDVYA